jgi:hypothetical protein
MSKVIRDVESLERFCQSWGFDLSKYVVFNKMRIVGWSKQVNARWVLQEFIDTGDSSNLEFARRELRKMFSTKPLLPSMIGTAEISELSGVAVHAMTLNEVRTHVRDFPVKLLPDEYERVYVDDDDSPDTMSGSYDYRKWDKDGDPGVTEVHLVVQLAAPHENTMRELERIVKAMRKEMIRRFVPNPTSTGRVPPIEKGLPFTHKNSFSKWVKYQVMPYIDINLACCLDKVKITDECLAFKLFVDDREAKGLDKLRQSTKFYAEQLTNTTTLDSLIAQAHLSRAPKTYSKPKRPKKS